jgi:hypothetical protein
VKLKKKHKKMIKLLNIDIDRTLERESAWHDPAARHGHASCWCKDKKVRNINQEDVEELMDKIFDFTNIMRRSYKLDMNVDLNSLALLDEDGAISINDE